MSIDLTALADELELLSWDFEPFGKIRKALARAVAALRALASQEKQDPVAWGDSWCVEKPISDMARNVMLQNPESADYAKRFSIPLYTAPPIPQPAPGWEGVLLKLQQMNVAGYLRLVASEVKNGFDRYELSKIADLIDSNPAAADSNASADRPADVTVDAARGLTDLEHTLLIAAKAAQNYIANTESELGMTLKSGELLRAAITKAEAYVFSPDPHASDCEKQGETTKSEGGGQVAPAKCSATGVHPTDTSCAAEPEVAPGPSEPRGCPTPGACSCPEGRVGDVMYIRRDDVRKILIEQPEENLDVTEGVLADIDGLTVFARSDIATTEITEADLADFLYDTGCVARGRGAWSGDLARAILDAYTVRRR